MRITKRALTAAVLLSCACFMAPYYAHAEEGITIDIGDTDIYTTSAPITINEDNGIGLSVNGTKESGGLNTLNIAHNITASGTNGIGLQVTSGNIYNINLQSGAAIEASGDGGIAVRFGNNASGNVAEMSIQNDDTLNTEYIPVVVNNFNIQGSLVGKSAAISIDSDATVRNINILSGASIEGNIISEHEAHTNLTFGGKYSKEEIAAYKNDSANNNYEPDDNFNMSYTYNITGSNINMHIAGGTLEYNGTANVYNVTINEGATLKGAGTYILGEQAVAQNSNDGTTSTRGTFTNNGTFDLGDGIKENITITGNYEQTSTGNLGVDFDTNSMSDKLNITEGSATLNGKITLTPQVDYYYNGQVIKLNPIVSVDVGKNLDASTAKPETNNISPVLKFTVADNNAKTTVNGQEYVCDYATTKYVINVERVEQGYQNVATDDISSGIGSAIDIDSQKKKDDEQYVLTIDKEKLLTSLDFPLTITNTDAEKKKVINTNIKKLNPNVVSSNAQAVLTTHTTLNNLVSVTSLVNAGSMSMNTPVALKRGGLGPNRIEPPKYNSWRNIVIPFAGYTDQHNGSSGYTNHNSGVIGAMERTFANGLTHGYHAAINHQSTEDSGSTIKGEGIYLGTHASYAPVEWNGWSVFGSARFGVEQMRSHRTVYIADSLKPYYSTADGDWTGYSGSFNVGAALTKEHGAVKSGPFAALDYSFAHRPSVHEDGGAVRTNLESATYDSLRTQLGYRLVTNPKPLDSYDSTQWQAHASVAWNHELLSDNGRTSYQLVEFPGATIEDDVETYGRDSMSIAAGIIFKTPKRLDVGLTLGSDIYRHGGSSIYGKMNFEWKF